MQTDVLIVGQGLAGTFLAPALEKERLSIAVIDEARPVTASGIASGIINPVTGRRIVKTWMIDDLMPFAWNAFREAGAALGINCIRETAVIDSFPSPQMRLAFLQRLEEDQQYLSLPTSTGDEQQRFLNYDFGYGIISPCYLCDVHTLLQAYRKKLALRGILMEERFEWSRLAVTGTGIRYKDISAGKIIFCDGISGAVNPYFGNLPFAPSKGEALIAAIDGLPPTAIYKKGLSIVPWKPGLFWIGSSHEWQYETDQPTATFREKTMSWMKSFLKIPFTITDHVAAVRPATLERRPFAGFHPQHPHVGIFNGMGTKGCSLAPYFASQLAAHCSKGTPLLPEADVQRFRKILARNMGG